jgi:hypothetical protein
MPFRSGQTSFDHAGNTQALGPGCLFQPFLLGFTHADDRTNWSVGGRDAIVPYTDISSNFLTLLFAHHLRPPENLLVRKLVDIAISYNNLTFFL